MCVIMFGHPCSKLLGMGIPGNARVRETILPSKRIMGMARATQGRCGINVPSRSPNRPFVVGLRIGRTSKTTSKCQSTLAWQCPHRTVRLLWRAVGVGCRRGAVLFGRHILVPIR